MRGKKWTSTFGRVAGAVAVSAIASLLLLGCGSSGSGSGNGKLQVVAAENFWGSIAAQIGGDKVSVTNIINNPDADPHSYEPTAANGRSMATADYAIVNGAGYDAWADKLLKANPNQKRTTLDVGNLMGVKEGGNPHMWYSPTYVHRVIDQVTSDLKKLDSNDSSYFDQQRSDYMSKGLANYERLQSDIKKRFANTPVGSTESIFAYLSKDIGLNLISPPAYMTAISEGTDPTAQDKATFDQQITQHQIKVLVFNKQNSTPDVNALVQKAKDQKISVVSITETLEPAGASFQQWQSAQLQALDTTLAQASA